MYKKNPKNNQSGKGIMVYLTLINQKQKITTMNGLDLETLGFWLIMPKKDTALHAHKHVFETWSTTFLHVHIVPLLCTLHHKVWHNTPFFQWLRQKHISYTYKKNYISRLSFPIVWELNILHMSNPMMIWKASFLKIVVNNLRHKYSISHINLASIAPTLLLLRCNPPIPPLNAL